MPALFAAIGLGSGDIPETEGAKTVKKPQGLKREHLRYKCDTGFGLFRREDLGINYWRGFKGLHNARTLQAGYRRFAMANASSISSLSISRLITVPALITLGITILRLVGEMQHWSPKLFNPAAGGAGAIVGIAWLPFIFGPYFALRLAGTAEGPSSAWKVIGFAVLGLVLMVVGSFAFAPQIKFPGKLPLGLVVIAAGAAVQFSAWSALARTLVAYGFAARIPVAIVMFFAIRGSWGTHYDALPPNYTGPMDFWGRYFMIGLVPQLIFWVAYTVVFGSLCGGITAAIKGRGQSAVAAA
jgi:hypothetical protein